MSFFSCCGSSKIPGPICGNPLNGLCEKVCIETNRVFDAAIIQKQLNDQVVTLSNLEPENPTFPLTFVSGESANDEVVLDDVQIIRMTDRPNFARVAGNAIIPVVIKYTDANGVEGQGFSTVSVPFDIVLFVPQDAMIGVKVTGSARVIFPIGTYQSGTTFILEGCVNLIIRIIVPTQLLMPTYGYCLIPKATEFSENICQGFFDQPLYPIGTTATTSSGTTN